MISAAELAAIVEVTHEDPHRILGPHLVAAPRPCVVVRVFRPDALRIVILPDDPSLTAREASCIHPAGLFEVVFDNTAETFSYIVQLFGAAGVEGRYRDPYSYAPTLGPLDLHLFTEGKHRSLHHVFGARILRHQGGGAASDGRENDGVAFTVWAPEARRVSVVGAFNNWDGRYHPMRRLAGNIWEIFIPGCREGTLYKLEILGRDGQRHVKTDPFASRTEVRPDTAGVVHTSRYVFRDQTFLERRAQVDPLREPMSIYEVHLGGFLRVADERGHGAVDLPNGGHTGRYLTYREIAPHLVSHVKKLGFSHVELMPITEHPFDGSWGYQCTGYFAPTARFGDPDGLKFLIDELHQAGIGVLLDWVPAHFPRDAHGLRRFDGSAVYEHLDPRKGEHADWGTMVFNYGRPEVRNFLLASALYWITEYHFDGLRVDAVASMLYLDYSRKAGEWEPNKYGGRENLEAIAFLRELNELVHEHGRGAMVIAEESTSWPAVSQPTYLGGLGFSLKWNMGWMHDTLAYFSLDPIHRRVHHGKITFGFMYAWSERFVLALSHDEVVHLKRSLLNKLQGDRWTRFANLRALYGWMFAHPGKKLLFMGAEFGQDHEFAETRSLDWHLLDDPYHRGVAKLMARLHELYRAHPALYRLDTSPTGFSWIDANDADQSIATFLRFDEVLLEERVPGEGNEQAAARLGRFVLVALNATPVVRHGYRIGVPHTGDLQLILNTDATEFSGSGVTPAAPTAAVLSATATPCHGRPASVVMTLPPMSVLWFEGRPAPVSVQARVFVYGSLRLGEKHHGELAGAVFAGRTRTALGFSLFDLGEYPAMVAAGEGTVVGELYNVTGDIIKHLDQFEAVDEPGYFRSLILLADGQYAEAYLFAPQAVPMGAKVLSSGDWSNRLPNKAVTQLP